METTGDTRATPSPPRTLTLSIRTGGGNWGSKKTCTTTSTTPTATITPTRLATVFRPRRDPVSLKADLKPEAHFLVKRIPKVFGLRLVNRFNDREIMLVIAGSCYHNGGPDAVGGSAFVFGADDEEVDEDSDGEEEEEEEDGDDDDDDHKTAEKRTRTRTRTKTGTRIWPVSFRPSRLATLPARTKLDTCNRAELSAAIEALRFRDWADEGWRRVIVLTDLEYLVRGATEWLPKWVAEGWRMPRSRSGRTRPNRELWETLQARIDKLFAAGCEVSFWQVGVDEYKRNANGILAQAKQAAHKVAMTRP
ncbi:hypothetical protein VTH82DRAFT_8611 [Thermothelomyces myriococcoides]